MSSVSERLVSWAVSGPSSSPRRGPCATEPTPTKRCEFGLTCTNLFAVFLNYYVNSYIFFLFWNTLMPCAPLKTCRS